ncbi:hypothetical protein V5799_016993 [Amblyomma americanum]|uniref:Secreted metalloprotease n=1 Tax=Amblyomma americanum TaxID=6943 RepID=A0AAQ4F3J5_AMBAM
MLVLAAVLSLVSITSSVTLKEELVYPRLLQERSANGELLLRVSDDMTLRLRKSSVLASDLFFTTNADGKSEHTLEGILSPNLRIKPLLTEERTVGAPIVHKLYEIEEPKMDLRESAQPPAVAKELPEEYVSELHVVSCSSHEKQFATNEELIAYLAVLMNAVNIWYEGMEEPRLKLKVVGITRNSDGESEVKEEGYLMADRTLNQFSDYADKKIPGSPDAIYMITKHVPQKCLDETSQRDYMTRHKKLPGQMITEEEYCKILFKAQGTGMPVKEGILSPNLRIKPLLTEQRSFGAPIVHKLYEIEEPKKDLRESG